MSRPSPLQAIITEVTPLLATDTLGDAARRLAEEGIPLPVVSAEGVYVGLLAEADLLRALIPSYLAELRHAGFLRADPPAFLRHAAEASRTLLGEISLPARETVGPECSEAHAAELLLHSAVTVLPVVVEGRPVGVVRAADLCVALTT
jgi:CBS domain-containing protein